MPDPSGLERACAARMSHIKINLKGVTNMVKCNDRCVPCCDFCIYVIHDEFEYDNEIISGEPIGCMLHTNSEFTGSYCNDFHCFNSPN